MATEAGGGITLDLSAASGRFQCEWLGPRTGERSAGGNVPGGGSRSLRAPDSEDWVLLVTARTRSGH